MFQVHVGLLENLKNLKLHEFFSVNDTEYINISNVQITNPSSTMGVKNAMTKWMRANG